MPPNESIPYFYSSLSEEARSVTPRWDCEGSTDSIGIRCPCASSPSLLIHQFLRQRLQLSHARVDTGFPDGRGHHATKLG